MSAARDMLTQAATIIAGTITDLTGAIGRRVLDNPPPDRRSYKATLDINILAVPGP